jgi:hypothetical protein
MFALTNIIEQIYENFVKQKMAAGGGKREERDRDGVWKFVVVVALIFLRRFSLVSVIITAVSTSFVFCFVVLLFFLDYDGKREREREREREKNRSR